MKYIKPIFILILFLSTSIFASTQQLAAAQLSELLNKFTTFQAHFTQVTQTAHMEVLQKSEGEMMLSRPGHFRWETQSPEHQIVITNGKQLWIYDVALKQATEQSIVNAPMNPAKLLSGNIDELLKQFDVTMIPHSTIRVFQLTPKQPNQSFRFVALVFKNDELIKMQIQTNLEQTSEFSFSHIKMNQNISPSLFEFKAAKGVDVMQ